MNLTLTPISGKNWYPGFFEIWEDVGGKTVFGKNLLSTLFYIFEKLFQEYSF